MVRSCLLRLQAADGRYGEGHRNFGRMARKRRQAPRRLAVQCPGGHGVEQRYHGREVAATWDWHWPQRSRAAICSSLVGCHSDSLRSITSKMSSLEHLWPLKDLQPHLGQIERMLQTVVDA